MSKLDDLLTEADGCTKDHPLDEWDTVPVHKDIEAARAELAAMREVIARADELVNVTDRLGEQAHDALRFYKGALPDAVEANISRVKDDAKLAIFYYRAARESVK